MTLLESWAVKNLPLPAILVVAGCMLAILAHGPAERWLVVVGGSLIGGGVTLLIVQAMRFERRTDVWEATYQGLPCSVTVLHRPGFAPSVYALGFLCSQCDSVLSRKMQDLGGGRLGPRQLHCGQCGTSDEGTGDPYDAAKAHFNGKLAMGKPLGRLKHRSTMRSKPSS